MSPGHPTHVRKLARAASFVMSTNQSGKLKTLDRCLFHPCKKEGAKLPDSGRGLRTRRHSGSQTSPSEHKAAGYGNFPWQPDMPFTKAGELTAFCHSSVLASSQRLFVPRRAEEADHPEEQRAGGQPRLRAGAALLGSRLFPENPYQAFSFKTLSKILCSLGTAHHSMALEPDPPLLATAVGNGFTAIPGKLRGKAMGGQTRITSFAQFSGTGSSPAAGCRSQTLTEEDYFET